MRYFLESLFKAMTNDPFFRRSNISVYAVVDEITTLASIKLQKTPAALSLRKYAQLGRFRKLGLIWGAQNYSDVAYPIRSNTRYLFIFHSNSSKEKNQIASDFSLSNAQVESINNLPKFHMLAVAQSEKFIVYSPDGSKRESEIGEIFQGVSIPPRSHHSHPKYDLGGQNAS